MDDKRGYFKFIGSKPNWGALGICSTPHTPQVVLALGTVGEHPSRMGVPLCRQPTTHLTDKGAWRHPCPRSLTRVQPRAPPPDPDPGKAPPNQEPEASGAQLPAPPSRVTGFTACGAAPWWTEVPLASPGAFLQASLGPGLIPVPSPPRGVTLSARQAGPVSARTLCLASQ